MCREAKGTANGLSVVGKARRRDIGEVSQMIRQRPSGWNGKRKNGRLGGCVCWMEEGIVGFQRQLRRSSERQVSPSPGVNNAATDDDAMSRA